MDGMLDTLIDVLLGVVFFVALFGFIITQINGFAWSAVNISGTVYNLSWVPFIVVIILVAILIYGAVKYLKRGKGSR